MPSCLESFPRTSEDCARTWPTLRQTIHSGVPTLAVFHPPSRKRRVWRAYHTLLFR